MAKPKAGLLKYALLLVSICIVAYVASLQKKPGLPQLLRFSQETRQFSISTGTSIPDGDIIRGVHLPPAKLSEMIKAKGSRTPLLNEVLRLAPQSFPPHARIVGVEQEWGKISGKNSGVRNTSYFRIDLNRAFDNRRFWRRVKDHNSIVAFHALARNVAFQNEPKGIALPVLFTIEGKPARTFGAFDASKPLLPQKIMRPSRPKPKRTG